MIRAILIPVLVVACALYARAGDEYSFAAGSAVESVQDFESYEDGAVDIHRGLEGDRNFWSVPDDVSLVKTTIREDAFGGKYLDVNTSERPDEGLMRTFVPHAACTNAITNAYVSASEYSDLYTVFRTKFALYDNGSSPTCDSRDRLVIWALKDPESLNGQGSLYVTAGHYVGSFRHPVRHDFKIASTNIDPEAWHEVTIRAISDISTGVHALGFELWIDGNPVYGDDDYSVADFDLEPYLSAEARSLLGDRRLFPALTVPGLNTSVGLGGVSFTGLGEIDDVSVATNAPAEWAKAPRTFSLRWDAGITALRYAYGSVTSSVPVSVVPSRCVVFEIPAAETSIDVVAEYDTAEDYSQGFWSADGSCSVVTNVIGAVTNYSFRCDATRRPGTGYVRSFRREIGLGGGIGSFASFRDAVEQAAAQGGLTIVLNEDFAASRDTADEGLVMIDRGESVKIDLNGHSITNAVGEYPTIVNYGVLTIFDSHGGGRVVPYAPFTGDTNDWRQVAIQNYASLKVRPELIVSGGAYDGFICNSGVVTNSASVARVEGSFIITRSEYAQEEPRFAGNADGEFPYERHLNDPTLYYAYDDSYWSPLTNAFIWCGKGVDDKWSTPENWRCNEVPGAGDFVIFPAAGTNAWEADMGSGIEARNIWFAGDVILHGSADFTDVKWKIPAAGRVRGDAVLAWVGKLPPSLSTLLDARWAGKVAIRNVGNSSPKLMSDMASWGSSLSTVTFNGVRGYYHLAGTITVPYTLELVNGSNGYAWKNDAGFTGGIIDIPRLIGDGLFVSPKNTIANRQVIVFRDVMSFSGSMDIQGKRVVIGSGDVATLEAGSITWSDGVKVKSGFVPSCRVAAFGGAMEYTGSYGDFIAEYTGFTVDDSAAVVNMVQLGELAELCVTNPVGKVRIVEWSDDAIIVNGRRVVTNELLAANSLSSIKAPAKAVKKLAFANYYTAEVTTNEDRMVTVKLALNELAVPVIGASGDESAKITFADGMASIIVSDTIDGFWYGLEYKATLSDEWPAEPYIWSVSNPLNGGMVELIAPAEGPSGFYRVVVSDIEPGKEGIK